MPRTLAESAGLDATTVLATLYKAHHASFVAHGSKAATGSEDGDDAGSDSSEAADWTAGVDVENSDGSGVLDAEDEGILDLLVAKSWAIKLATEAARTVLAVDQIIVARQAGGPKPPQPGGGDWDAD